MKHSFAKECYTILRSIPKVIERIMILIDISNPYLTGHYKEELNNKLVEFKIAIDKFLR